MAPPAGVEPTTYRLGVGPDAISTTAHNNKPLIFSGVRLWWSAVGNCPFRAGTVAKLWQDNPMLGSPGRRVFVKKYGRVGAVVPHDERDALRQTL
jgi:hypothetical protein